MDSPEFRSRDHGRMDHQRRLAPQEWGPGAAVDQGWEDGTQDGIIFYKTEMMAVAQLRASSYTPRYNSAIMLEGFQGVFN